MIEADVFEYLSCEVKRTGAQSLSIAVTKFPDNYVAAFDHAGNCRCGKTIEEAVAQFPNREQQVANMIKTAQELESQAQEHRDNAAKLSGEPKSFGPDD